jgi:hypothetical protein
MSFCLGYRDCIKDYACLYEFLKSKGINLEKVEKDKPNDDLEINLQFSEDFCTNYGHLSFKEYFKMKYNVESTLEGNVMDIIADKIDEVKKLIKYKPEKTSGPEGKYVEIYSFIKFYEYYINL